MKREEMIQAIKDGSHVLDVVRHSKEAQRFVKDYILNGSAFGYFDDESYYGKDIDGDLGFLEKSEINNRPIIKLSDILDNSENISVNRNKNPRYPFLI